MKIEDAMRLKADIETLDAASIILMGFITCSDSEKASSDFRDALMTLLKIRAIMRKLLDA